MGDDTFPGFRRPEKDFFRLPNEWTDITSEIDNIAELKVVEYTLRHTWGYKQGYGYAKYISVDEFMNGRFRADGETRMDKGTGLSEMSVRNGLNKAIKHGYIICDMDTRDMARIKKYYCIRMLEVQSLDPSPDESEVNTLDPEQGLGVQNLDLNTHNLDPHRGKNIRPRSEKESARQPEKDISSKKEGTNPPSLTLSSEEQCVYDLYSEIGAVVKLSETAKKHCAELAPHIHSLDDMKALYAFVLPKIYGDDKTVYLGNMVRYLKPWLQSKAPEPPAKPRTGVRNFTQERVERERLAKQQAANEQKEVKI